MRKAVLLLMAVALVHAVSCSDDPIPPPDHITVAEAWALFEAGKFADARSAFTSLTDEGAEAYVGLGWSNLRLDELTAADASFANASTHIDGVAGWAFVKWALEQYGDAIVYADYVLTKNTAYIFEHDKTVNHEDLILQAGYSYLHLGNYEKCIEKIKLLDQNFDAEPTDSDIEETLLAKLESLRKAMG